MASFFPKKRDHVEPQSGSVQPKVEPISHREIQ